MEKMEEGKNVDHFMNRRDLEQRNRDPGFHPWWIIRCLNHFRSLWVLSPQVSGNKDLCKNQCIDDVSDHLDLCPCIYIYTRIYKYIKINCHIFHTKDRSEPWTWVGSWKQSFLNVYFSFWMEFLDSKMNSRNPNLSELKTTNMAQQHGRHIQGWMHGSLHRSHEFLVD